MTSSVGIPRILKRAAVEPFASTSSLPTLTRPLYSAAMESTVGASARHGAHHAAQKSTSTGVVDFTTSVSKLESVISRVFSPMNPPKKFYSSCEESPKSIGGGIMQTFLCPAREREISKSDESCISNPKFRNCKLDYANCGSPI